MKVVSMDHVDIQRIKELQKKLSDLRSKENEAWSEIQHVTREFGFKYGVERPVFSSDYQYLVEGPKNL